MRSLEAAAVDFLRLFHRTRFVCPADRMNRAQNSTEPSRADTKPAATARHAACSPAALVGCVLISGGNVLWRLEVCSIHPAKQSRGRRPLWDKRWTSPPPPEENDEAA